MKRKEVGLLVSLAVASGMAVREWRKNQRFNDQFKKQTEDRLVNGLMEVQDDAGDETSSTKG
ncbi:hypothetical protein [Exiguobacterium antarcticum]|uniref:Uncharacterized protein n=1 Tax=Exiguobacterium antarcticum TaxID=132920 RepID=A0ABT6QXQ4_9BACL|nr:hypothetical protein [Exiguobacterium antarcticum]AFS71247.1 Hypothetical protein Eab7_2147 [Exiguobacterium antarcticum B7]MDI3233460.1 hypothetical protein [Exiguobacterium antarcticum]